MENSQSDPPNAFAVQENQTVVEQEPSTIAVAQPITDSDQAEPIPSQTPVETPVSIAQPVTKDQNSDQKPDAPSADSVVELHEGEIKASTPSQTAPSTSSSQSYVPPVKRFRAVNVNKEFLRTQSTANLGTGSVASSSSKQTGTIARPTPQSAQSHSRLVTTKLTATPLSTSPGAGWTRPNSVTPPAPSPGSAPGQGKDLPTLTTVGGHGPPQIAPGGKIIQPQVLKQKIESTARPAWRNVQPGLGSVPTQGDFPTAAEAAQTRAMKNAEAKAAVVVAEAQKQAMSETADAFRGVHLDPNAHHWDEVDDDNDDFLGGVIEFGDGRQYTIQVTEGSTKNPNVPDGRNADAPVSKAERFADDYDRSWPKTQTRGGEQGQPPHDGHGRQNWASQSEASSNAPHSPVSLRDGHQSRLLFNERSNRMEPFSGKQHPPPTHAAPHIVPRKATHDPSSRSTHGRFERDAPPHADLVHDDSHVRSRGPPTGPSNGFSDRQGRQDWDARSRHTNDTSSYGREPSLSRSSVHEQSVIGDDVASRHGNAWGIQRHGPARELPPHLAQPQSSSPVLETRGTRSVSERSPQDSRPSLPSTAADAVRGHDSQPVAEPPVVPSPEELATLRKAFLADNAEKAKRRRQEEEAERQRAQERAKEKAAKLAALMESTKPASKSLSPEVRSREVPKVHANDPQVLDIIEEAVQSATQAGTDSESKQGSANGRPMPRRLSSARSIDHQPISPVLSTHSRSVGEPPVSERADSWRSTAKVKQAEITTEVSTIEEKQGTVQVQVALPEVHAFEFETEGHTEVLDFTEIGSLSRDAVNSTRPSRPVASDFFTGDPPKSYSAVAEGRIHGSAAEPQAHVSIATTSSNSHVILTTPGGKSIRAPNAIFKEAPLSTLDDTMSRIKGALDGMHIHGEEEQAEPARLVPISIVTSHAVHPPAQSIAAPQRLNKWLPPALRPQGADFKHRRTEDFANTSYEPPTNTMSSHGRPVVLIPKACKHVSSVAKKQLMAFRSFNGPVRWDILSFEPPVEGMTKKSLSVNDVLFKKPVGPFKQRKYVVSLPKRKHSPRQREYELKSTHKADLPLENTRDSATGGVFGRPKVDGSAPWRSPEINTVPELKTENDLSTASLNVTSRSPPPDVPTAKNSGKATDRVSEASSVSVQVTSSTKSTSFTVGKDDPVVVSSKAVGVIGQSPKRVVSEGTAKVETYAETKVSFTPRGMSKPLPSSISPSLRKLDLGHPEVNGETVISTSNAPVHTATPPPQPSTSAWAKSPARVPDPEHLRAVWSQPVSKDPLPGVNSLKGIADDLTSVPFTLHEVKSESGTPPPTSSGTSSSHPSRMTASEVTRAFQTVPTAPANSAPTPSSRTAHLPPNTNSPIASERSLKASANGFPPPAMYSNPPAGQAYYYTSPVSNHSPSPPTVVYPHVMQNGVSASPASPYAQPVWMPVMQQPGQQMLRPQPSSPYSPQLIPYQTTGPQNGMMRPPTNNLVPNHTGPGAYGASAPGQMIVSPVMHHATPAQPMVYPGSPMLVHVAGPAPGGVGQHPQQRPYTQNVVGVGRGGVPVNSPPHPYPHQHQVHHHQAMHPAGHAGHQPHVRYPAPNQGYNAAQIPHAYVAQQW